MVEEPTQTIIPNVKLKSKVSLATLLFLSPHPQNFAHWPQEKIQPAPMGGCAGVRVAVVTWAYSLCSPSAEGDATFDGAGSDNIEGLLASVGVKCRRDEDHSDN
jgi:hypothetical protein